MNARSFLLTLAVSVAVSTLGCSDDAPTGPDSGAECTALEGCPNDRVCLQGECVPRCTTDTQCARTEMCSLSGVCVPRVGPIPDAGGSDVGQPDVPPVDPCADLACADGTAFCLGRVPACVACLSGADCLADPTTVCDVGRGTCVAPRTADCAPCNEDAECNADGQPARVCRPLGADVEQVCLESCVMQSDCVAGTRCVDDVCEPVIGSCRSFRSGRDGAACATAADCAPLGATAAPEQCTAGVCHHICRFPGACDPSPDVPCECGGATQCAADMICRPSS